MANVRKKISELTALTSASLDTVVVGVDNGTTYKIELDVLADAVTSRVNILDRDRLQSLESVTSSFETKGRSVVSSSAQISNLGFVASSETSSFVRETETGSFITSIPTGLISSSTQISNFGFISSSVDITSLNSYTSSQDSRNISFTNSINARLQTSSFNEFSASVHSEILAATNEQSFNGLISGSSQLTSSYDERYVLSGSITQTTWDNISGKPIGLISQSTDLSSLNQFTASISTASLVDRLDTIENVTSSYETKGSGILSGSVSYLDLTNIPSGIVSQSTDLSQLNSFTQSIDSRVDSLESSTSSYLTTLDGAITSSSQLTSSFDTRYTLSGSVQPLPSGLISGSSQLTSSYDTRYTLSGSVVSGTTPAGTISGSSQISAFGFVSGSYTTTASFNSFTASAQAVTTGSNSFNGTQTITGSLIVTTGSFVGSQILANTSSLYLTSGSNMYVQNNGLVEITGSIVVSGSNNINLIVPVLQIGTGSGDEGGEIQLAKAVTNTTLTGSAVTVDIYRDRLRVFEQGGDARGVHIDLSKTPGGVAGELIWKVSGLVNAGTFVQLDNLKCTVTTSGNRGLSIGAVSTNFTANISAYYAMSDGMAGTATNNISYTTTASTSAFSWHFTSEGDGSYYTIVDKTNNRMYRVTLMIGSGYNNNFISIERLY